MFLRRSRLISICLTLLLALPLPAGAAAHTKKRNRARGKPSVTKPVRAEPEPIENAPQPEPEEKAAPAGPKEQDVKVVPAPAAPGIEPARRAEQALHDAPAAPVEPPLSRQAFAFAGAGVFLLGGLAFGYSAQGEIKRAETISNAREASRTLDGARATAATANVLYGLAGVSTLYALALLVLPEPAAQKASLSFHF